MFILLKAQNTFNNYILGSPSFWWDRNFVFKQNYKLNDFNGNIFISVGAQAFYKKLTGSKAAKYNTELRVIQHANHEAAFPTSAIQGL